MNEVKHYRQRRRRLIVTIKFGMVLVCSLYGMALACCTYYLWHRSEYVLNFAVFLIAATGVIDVLLHLYYRREDSKIDALMEKKPKYRNITCSAPPNLNRFIGCDSRVISSELLRKQLETAIEREDYEDAALIRDELKRRNEHITNS